MPLNHLEGMDNVFLRHTMGHMVLSSDDDYRNYIKRLQAFPTQVFVFNLLSRKYFNLTITVFVLLKNYL